MVLWWATLVVSCWSMTWSSVVSVWCLWLVWNLLDLLCLFWPHDSVTCGRQPGPRSRLKKNCIYLQENEAELTLTGRSSKQKYTQAAAEKWQQPKNQKQKENIKILSGARLPETTKTCLAWAARVVFMPVLPGAQGLHADCVAEAFIDRLIAGNQEHVNAMRT